MSKIMEHAKFSDKELKQLIRNSNKKIDRLIQKYGDSAKINKMQMQRLKTDPIYGKLFQQGPNNTYNLSADISGLTSREKQQIYSELFYNYNKPVKGISDYKGIAQDIIEDPVIEEYVKNLLHTDELDLNNPQHIDEVIDVYYDFATAIQQYKNSNIDIDSLSPEAAEILHKSNKSYGELQKAAEFINKAMIDRKQKQSDIKNEGAKAHEEAVRKDLEEKIRKELSNQ